MRLEGRPDTLEGREGNSGPPAACCSVIGWGLVTPEEMAEVIFRALHSFTQQVVIKNLCSCPRSPRVNKVCRVLLPCS